MRNYITWLFPATFLFISSAFVPDFHPVVSEKTACATFNTAGEANEYQVIDAYAIRTPEAYTRNLKSLATYLTAPAHSETAKARSIYAWILSHIRYDGSIYSGQVYYSEVDYATKVLKSRRAVCTGFALLYKQLLKNAGVQVENVKGYSRVSDSQAGMPIPRLDHEWNAVRLDGDWYLVDLTWAATTAKDGRFNDHYFLTDPEQFIAQHYPNDTKWQLLSRPVSKSEFDRYPKIHDAYFRLGFNPVFPKNGLLRANGRVLLTFENPNQAVEFTCSVGKPKGIVTAQSDVAVRRQGSTYQLAVDLPYTGTYTIYVFAKPKSGYERIKSYEGIATFLVVNN